MALGRVVKCAPASFWFGLLFVSVLLGQQKQSVPGQRACRRANRGTPIPVMCPSNSSGMVAILGFYEKLRICARRFEVEDLAGYSSKI